MARLLGVAALTLVTGLSTAAFAATQGKTTTWNFKGDKVGSAPPGFVMEKSGGGAAGRWVIESEKLGNKGPAQNVLAQLDSSQAGDRMLTAIADQPSARDFSLSVMTRPVSGKLHEDAGLVFRYRDSGNYYLVSADALQKNVVLSSIKDGKRTDIDTQKANVTPGRWHRLSVIARGDRIQVLWDGRRVINKTDKTFTDAGKAGLSTMGDTVAYFDNLRLTSYDNGQRAASNQRYSPRKRAGTANAPAANRTNKSVNKAG